MLCASSAVIRFFDTAQGKPLGQTLSHPNVIVSVALNQQGIAPDRQVHALTLIKSGILCSLLLRTPILAATLCIH